MAMALDEPKDTDNSYDVNGFKFILDKEFDAKGPACIHRFYGVWI